MPPEAPVLALELLFDAVVARFAAEGPNASTPPYHQQVEQVFGWRWPAQQHTSARIVWIPGNPLGGVGRVAPARNPGGEPRSLGTLEEQFHVLISAQDPSDPENERLQYRCTRLLRDYWFRAVYLAARGTYQLDIEEWDVTKKERRFGTQLRVIGSVQSMLPDLPPAGSITTPAPDDTGAVIDVHELDVTEQLIVPHDAT